MLKETATSILGHNKDLDNDIFFTFFGIVVRNVSISLRKRESENVNNLQFTGERSS